MTCSRVFVDDTKDVTISNSVIGGRFNPLGTLSINNSTVTGGFSCSNFVSTSDVNLSLNSCMVISDSITVDASNPVTVHPADLDNGELVIQLPSFNSSYESSFILDDTQNGKYALKCRETSNGAYLVVAEKASAQGPFHIAFVPEEEGEIAVNTAQNNYVAVPDGNGFTVSSALVTFTCKNCGDIKTLNADISFTVKTESTCTQKGVTAYKATVEFNGNVYTDIKNIADISETGHRFKDGVCLICGEKQESDNSETVTKAPGTTGDNNAADNDAVSKNDSEKSPQTGFNYVSVILTAIFIALTVFILACVTVNRKKFSIK